MVRIQPAGQEPLDVYNVHLASEPERLNRVFVSRKEASDIRAVQLQELGGWIQRRTPASGVALVMGDFNIDETDELYSSLVKIAGIDTYRERLGCKLELNGVTKEVIRGYTYDPHANRYAVSPRNASERIDYIFARPREGKRLVGGVDRKFCTEVVSDHYGVEATIKYVN